MKASCGSNFKIMLVLVAIGFAGNSFALSVTAISPNSGPSTGGQLVRIYTNGVTINATPGSNTVLFGATAGTCTAVNVANNTLDVALTPAVAAGAVTITVNGTVSAAGLYTFVSRNNTLVVVVSDTVAKRAQIQWGSGTSLDDASTPVDHTVSPNLISNYAWTVKDSTLLASLQTDLGTIYRSDDAQNNKTINISNVSSTGSACTISAIATKTAGNFALAANAGPDVVAIKGSMGGAALVSLFTAQNLSVNLTTAVALPLVLEFDTPTTVSTANAGVLNTYNVTMTATAN